MGCLTRLTTEVPCLDRQSVPFDARRARMVLQVVSGQGRIWHLGPGSSRGVRGVARSLGRSVARSFGWRGPFGDQPKRGEMLHREIFRFHPGFFQEMFGDVGTHEGLNELDTRKTRFRAMA